MVDIGETVTSRRDGLAWWENEDWLAVWLGFLIVALVLVGIKPELPDLSWAGWGELVVVETTQNTFKGGSLI